MPIIQRAILIQMSVQMCENHATQTSVQSQTRTIILNLQIGKLLDEQLQTKKVGGRNFKLGMSFI